MAFPFPGYHPKGYQPQSDPEEPIPDSAKALAIKQGGEFIHPRTRHIYKWQDDIMLEAYPPGYESWWRVWGDTGMPAGELVELH